MKKHVRGDLLVTYQEDGMQKQVKLEGASLVLTWLDVKSDEPSKETKWFEVLAPWASPKVP